MTISLGFPLTGSVTCTVMYTSVIRFPKPYNEVDLGFRISLERCQLSVIL